MILDFGLWFWTLDFEFSTLTATFFHLQPTNDEKCCFWTFFQMHLIKKLWMHFFRFYFRKSPFRDREGNISHFRLHRKDIASIGEIRKIQNLSTNWVQRICVENSKLVFKAFLWHLIPFQKNRQQHNQKWGQPRERIYLSTYGNCCVFQKTVAYHTYRLKYCIKEGEH